MRIKLICVGKTKFNFLNEGTDIYKRRLEHYIKFQLIEVEESKEKAPKAKNTEEGKRILKQIKNQDRVVLLDDKGKQYNSSGFAEYIENCLNSTTTDIVFIVGGPYGFSEVVKKRANSLFSLSSLTFTHDMVRLFFTEQLYRAFTIIRNEPYHHR